MICFMLVDLDASVRLTGHKWLKIEDIGVLGPNNPSPSFDSAVRPAQRQ
jgi:hypothetical protein